MSPFCSQTRAGWRRAGQEEEEGSFPRRHCRQQLTARSLRDLYPLFIFEKHVTHFPEKSNQLLERQLEFLERLATTGIPWYYNKKVSYCTA